MSPPSQANGQVAADVLAGTKVRDVVALLADSELPVAVVDADGTRIGVVTRSDALSVIAGEGA
jgi:CBS-domain-containing membrane protein